MNYWTTKEINYLKSHYDKLPYADLADRLGRSVDSVKEKIKSEGLHLSKEDKANKYKAWGWKKRILKGFAKKPIDQILANLEITFIHIAKSSRFTSHQRALAKRGMMDFFVANIGMLVSNQRNIVELIITEVLNEYGSSMENLLNGRKENEVFYRFMLCYLLFTIAGLKDAAIAKIIGRDRSTAAYNRNEFLNIVKSNKNLEEIYIKIQSKI